MLIRCAGLPRVSSTIGGIRSEQRREAHGDHTKNDQTEKEETQWKLTPIVVS